jgi:hypothetical protein
MSYTDTTPKERNRKSFEIKGPSIFTDAPEEDELPDQTDYKFIGKTSDDLLRFKPNIHKLIQERVQEVTIKEKGGPVDPFIRECLHIFNGTYNVLVCEEEFSKIPKNDNFQQLVKKETVHPNSFSEMLVFCVFNFLGEPIFVSSHIALIWKLGWWNLYFVRFKLLILALRKLCLRNSSLW